MEPNMNRIARMFQESQEVVFVALIQVLTVATVYAFNASRIVA